MVRGAKKSNFFVTFEFLRYFLLDTPSIHVECKLTWLNYILCRAAEVFYSDPTGKDKHCRGLFWKWRNIQHYSVQWTFIVCGTNGRGDRLGNVQEN